MRRTTGVVCGRVIGVAAMLALAGCVADVGPERPLRMPTVGPSPPKAPVPPVVPAEVWRRVVAHAANEAWTEVARELATLPREERRSVVRTGIEALARDDLAQAGRVARGMPEGSLLHEAMNVVAQAMVARDVAAAITWALSTAMPAAEFAARLAVAEAGVARDAPEMLGRLAAWPAAAGRAEMLGFAAAAWAGRDAGAAVAWARGLAAGEDRTRVVTSMSFALAQTEPARAVQVVEGLPEGRDRWLVLGAIGQTWVARDPDEAWAWARRLPPGAAQEAALAGIETGLGGARARRQAGERVAAGRVRATGGGGAVVGVAAGELPPGLARDEALRREFEEALRESPARAAAWLATMPVPDRRQEMADELARRWLWVNPDAASAWMELHIPEPERRERLWREAGR